MGVFVVKNFRLRVVTTELKFLVNLTRFAQYVAKQVTMVEVYWQGAWSAELTASGF